MNNRWIASKFGLFNFWYYENQEFDLADGKYYLEVLTEVENL